MLSVRLKECRVMKKVTQRDVAIYLGIAERSYQNYETGAREPKLATLIKLANYFGVTTDYLLCRSEDLPK